jgi:SAM-dependent methyltransferase
MGFLAPYVPAEPEMLTQLGKLVPLSASDVFVDLGSGDGRVVRDAVKRYGCTGVCVELDDELMEQARELNEELHPEVQKKIDLLEGDFESVPWLAKNPTVVFAYLSQHALEALLPSLEQVYAGRGTVVSCVFPIPRWGARLRGSVPVGSSPREPRRLFVYKW